ncbi:hypothetical protein ACF0H5_001709 [Mactra antiquata]
MQKNSLLKHIIYYLTNEVKTRMINFWYKVLSGNQKKITYRIYQLMLSIPHFESKWMNKIQDILIETGRIDLWFNQFNLPQYSIKHTIKQILIDQYKQNWQSALQNSAKGRHYSIFKNDLLLEKYFLTLRRPNYTYLVKFRTGNHYLPAEVGRWHNIPLSDRKCLLCNKNDIGDEMHYLLICLFSDKKDINTLKDMFTLIQI